VAATTGTTVPPQKKGTRFSSRSAAARIGADPYAGRYPASCSVRAWVISVVASESSNLSYSRKNAPTRRLISSASDHGPPNPNREVVGVPGVPQASVARNAPGR